ncbi:mCG1042693, partial [Mus musculus]
ISEFEASLFYKVSSRTARAMQRNPVSKKAGEMAQWLRALTALPEVLSSIPSNHMVAHNHL